MTLEHNLDVAELIQKLSQIVLIVLLITMKAGTVRLLSVYLLGVLFYFYYVYFLGKADSFVHT